MSDIDPLDVRAYQLGFSPIDWAEKIVRASIEWHIIVKAGRVEDPQSFPGYHADLTLDALSRRILGQLLAAGWTPPRSWGSP